jgi:hypothetical protein
MGEVGDGGSRGEKNESGELSAREEDQEADFQRGSERRSFYWLGVDSGGARGGLLRSR